MDQRDSEREKTVFIGSITSDIGLALAKKYARDGYVISGTYRSSQLLPELYNLPKCHLFYCDFSNHETVRDTVSSFAKTHLRWNTFISCAATPVPLTSFFASDFDQWSQAIHINMIEHMRLLHGLHPLRDTHAVVNVVFFAGPATNNAVKNFSAAAVSKIALIKMCELLDAENDDLNVFIVGPGWTKTKTHQQIISDPHVSREKYEETVRFLQSQDGTSMDDIYDCIRWLSAKGRIVAGGRNFSVVHDCWGTEELACVLAGDPHMYKLRRYRNEWKDKAGE